MQVSKWIKRKYVCNTYIKSYGNHEYMILGFYILYLKKEKKVLHSFAQLAVTATSSETDS